MSLSSKLVAGYWMSLDELLERYRNHVGNFTVTLSPAEFKSIKKEATKLQLFITPSIFEGSYTLDIPNVVLKVVSSDRYLGTDIFGFPIYGNSELLYPSENGERILQPDLIGWNIQDSKFTEIEGWDPILEKRVVVKINVLKLRNPDLK